MTATNSTELAAVARHTGPLQINQIFRDQGFDRDIRIVHLNVPLDICVVFDCKSAAALPKVMRYESVMDAVVRRPRWPPKLPRFWPLQTPPPELIGNRG